MPVNKGLLLGAAFANGMNAFMDAREKGDLQRQRVALAQIEKQMKVAQLENLRTTGLMQGAKYDQFMATDPHVRAGAEYDAATAKWGSKTKEQEHLQSLVKTDVDRGTKSSLIDQEEQKALGLAQKALEQTATTELARTKADHQKFVTTIQQLGLGGTPPSEWGSRILDILEGGTIGQQAIIRSTLGITSAAELAEFTNTQSRRVSQSVIDARAAQAAYAGARTVTQSTVKDWYQAKIDELAAITTEDFETLIELGVPAERLPKSGLYKDLHFTDFEGLTLEKEKTYTYREIENEDGSKSIVALSDGVAKMVTMAGPTSPAAAQAEGVTEKAEVEDIDQAVEATVLSWKEAGKGAVLDFRLETSLRQEYMRDPHVSAWKEIDMLYSAAAAAHELSLDGTEPLLFVDQALINVFNKMLDYKSVVREGEYARTKAETSFVQRIVAETQKVRRGGSLSTIDREACMTMVGEFYRLHRQRYLEKREAMWTTVESMNRRKRDVEGVDFDLLSAKDVTGNMPYPEERIILGSSEPGWERSPTGKGKEAKTTAGDEDEMDGAIGF